MSDNKIRDVSDKFKKAQEKKEKTIIDKLAEEEKNKKLNELLFDIENLYALLVIGEASDVDIMFNKDGKTMVITDRKQPVNPMELANRVINNKIHSSPPILILCSVYHIYDVITRHKSLLFQIVCTFKWFLKQ